jgi:hypothetical protein
VAAAAAYLVLEVHLDGLALHGRFGVDFHWRLGWCRETAAGGEARRLNPRLGRGGVEESGAWSRRRGEAGNGE